MSQATQQKQHQQHQQKKSDLDGVLSELIGQDVSRMSDADKIKAIQKVSKANDRILDTDDSLYPKGADRVNMKLGRYPLKMYRVSQVTKRTGAQDLSPVELYHTHKISAVGAVYSRLGIKSTDYRCEAVEIDPETKEPVIDKPVTKKAG